MIFSSINQLYSFCIILFGGIICGIFNGILGVLTLKSRQKNIFNFIFRLICSIFFTIFLIFFVNLYYFGIFSPATILAFTLGYIWIEKTLRKLLDFFEIKVYHIYIAILKSIKRYLARKNESIKD